MDEVLIGLEIHCQLTSLRSKLFCSCIGNYRDMKPNTNICHVCCGFPGSLPILNKRAIEYAAMISSALKCEIPERILFYRKNYFYPDLPKNFQITQYNEYGLTSIGNDGFVKYSNAKKVRIRRVQLEEDPARLSYENRLKNNYALIDYNRAGVALIEIVTEPDFGNPLEVRSFLNKLISILEHTGVCNPFLEGAVRCDANVSIKGGNRVEIKNVNSIKDVERALNYEISRQTSLSTHKIKINSETRHWDDQRRVTKMARTKEEEQDYKYFPEPDIPEIILGTEFKKHVESITPELPDERFARFIEEFHVSEHVCEILINHKNLADFFEETIKIYSSPLEISNWIVTDFRGLIDEENKNDLTLVKVKPKHIAELIKLLEEKMINRTIAKKMLIEISKTGTMPSEILDKNKDTRIEDEQLLSDTIDLVFKNEISAVNDAKTNSGAVNFILGRVMKYTNGRADPQIAIKLINEKLQQS